MKNISFSVNMHDRDGDVYLEGIFLHIGEDVILKLNNKKELELMIASLKVIKGEITETYPNVL